MRTRERKKGWEKLSGMEGYYLTRVDLMAYFTLSTWSPFAISFRLRAPHVIAFSRTISTVSHSSIRRSNNVSRLVCSLLESQVRMHTTMGIPLNEESIFPTDKCEDVARSEFPMFADRRKGLASKVRARFLSREFMPIRRKIRWDVCALRDFFYGQGEKRRNWMSDSSWKTTVDRAFLHGSLRRSRVLSTWR